MHIILPIAFFSACGAQGDSSRVHAPGAQLRTIPLGFILANDLPSGMNTCMSAEDSPRGGLTVQLRSQRSCLHEESGHSAILGQPKTNMKIVEKKPVAQDLLHERKG